MALDKNNAVVSNVVCDGHKTNKGVHKLSNVSGERGHLRNCIMHPAKHDHKIYFLFDVPHIMKCIRNHTIKREYVQVINSTNSIH